MRKLRRIFCECASNCTELEVNYDPDSSCGCHSNLMFKFKRSTQHGIWRLLKSMLFGFSTDAFISLADARRIRNMLNEYITQY